MDATRSAGGREGRCGKLDASARNENRLMINAAIRMALRLLPERLRQRARAVGDEHKDIARGVTTVAIFLIAAKLIVAIKEMAIAWRFGVSDVVDAYLFVFSLVNWPIMVWFSVLSVVLVPLGARIRNDRPEEMPGFRAELLGLTLLLGVALSLLAWIGLPVLLRSALTGLPAATVQQVLPMTPPLAMLLLPGMLVSLLSSWMLSAGRHANTFLEAMPALVILVALLTFTSPGAEPGAIATLGYANRLLTLFLGLGATVVSRATLPVFSRMQAQGGRQAQDLAARWAQMFFVFGVMAMVVGWWLAPWMVRAVFERGAFTALNTAAVANILRYGMTQLPFYFSGIVLVSLLSSHRKYWTLTVIGGVNLCIKAGLNWALMPSFGVSGLMIASSVMVAMSTLLLRLMLSRSYVMKH